MRGWVHESMEGHAEARGGAIYANGCVTAVWRWRNNLYVTGVCAQRWRTRDAGLGLWAATTAAMVRGSFCPRWRDNKWCGRFRSGARVSQRRKSASSYFCSSDWWKRDGR